MGERKKERKKEEPRPEQSPAGVHRSNPGTGSRPYGEERGGGIPQELKPPGGEQKFEPFGLQSFSEDELFEPDFRIRARKMNSSPQSAFERKRNYSSERDARKANWSGKRKRTKF